MKKYIAIVACLMGLVFTACAHQKKTVSKGRKGRAPAVSAIHLSRGACFGRCPVYTLILHRNGLAVYRGKINTEFVGVYQKQYKPQEVAELFSRVDAYRVDTLQGNYTVSIADLPGIDFEFELDTKRDKKVRNASFGPRYLTSFARAMDEAVHPDASWKKISDAPPAD